MKQHFALAVLNSLFKVPVRSCVQSLIGGRNILLKFLLALVVFGGTWQGAWATNPEPIIDTVWNKQLSAFIYNVKFLPGDSIIFVAAGNTLFFIETKSGKVLEKYSNDLELIAALPTPDGNKILLGTLTKDTNLTLKTFDLKTKTFGKNFEGQINVPYPNFENFNYLEISKDGKYAATTCLEHGLGFWDIRNEILINVYYQKYNYYYDCSFSYDSKYLLLNMFNNFGKIGDEYIHVQKFLVPSLDSLGHQKNLTAKMFNNSSHFLFNDKRDLMNQNILLHQLDSFKYIKTYPFDNFSCDFGGHQVITLTPDDRFLLTSSDAQILSVWDLERELNVVNYLDIPKSASYTISVSQNMKFISCGNNGKLVLLNAYWEPNTVRDVFTDTLRKINVYPKNNSSILAIEFINQNPEPLNFNIASIRGEIVFMQKNLLTSTGFCNLEIQIPNIQSGEYLISLVGKRNKYFGKFIIVK